MTVSPIIVLASGSPRRSALLRQAGFDVAVCPADIDESVLPEETPRQLVERLAFRKAAETAAIHPQEIVIGADTVVRKDDRILGKPVDMREAAEMLRFLSGATHQVLTGVSILRMSDQTQITWTCVTRVTFKSLTDDDINAYHALINPLDKAGAYAIQEHGDRIVADTDGSYSNIVGLPIEDVVERLGLVTGNQ
jgi:septum formation protein